MNLLNVSIRVAANERGLAQWRYSVIRQPGATAPDQVYGYKFSGCSLEIGWPVAEAE